MTSFIQYGEHGKIPVGAKELTSDQLLSFFKKVIESWDPYQDIWALRFGPGIIGAASAASGIWLNYMFRRKLRLGTIGNFATYFPIAVLPTAMTIGVQQAVMSSLSIESNGIQFIHFHCLSNSSLCYRKSCWNHSIVHYVYKRKRLSINSALESFNRYCLHQSQPYCMQHEITHTESRQSDRIRNCFGNFMWNLYVRWLFRLWSVRHCKLLSCNSLPTRNVSISSIWWRKYHGIYHEDLASVIQSKFTQNQFMRNVNVVRSISFIE